MEKIPIQLIAIIGVAYISLLFFIAYRGDKKQNQFFLKNNAVIYSLSLAVYCSSWTFFGSVGAASNNGWDYFAVYLGPILLFVFGHRFIERIIVISKNNNITSISDFISCRYGKSRYIAVLVTIIAVTGSLPYISLQLQAMSMAFNALVGHQAIATEVYNTSGNFYLDSAFYTAIILALFSMLFGTRHHSATEHHRGLIQAIAFESLVKLAAILMAAYFAADLLFEKFEFKQILNTGLKLSFTQSGPASSSNFDFLIIVLLSTGAIILLPRQFQVTVVEAENHHQVKVARWLLPAYLLIVSLVVVPIATSGMMLLPAGSNADLFVLSIPLINDQYSLALFVFIGGLSAATGMVIVASISLSTMISNDIIMPLLIRVKHLKLLQQPDLTSIILNIRRVSIALLLLASYAYFRYSGNKQGLANIGLLSFAAIIQLAPPIIAALYWRKANQRGAQLALTAGYLTWIYCLLLPNFITPEKLDQFFAAYIWLHPYHLFGSNTLSPLSHGVVWSLCLNCSALIFGSLRYKASIMDKVQASLFTYTDVEYQQNLIHRDVSKQLATVEEARALSQSIIGSDSTKILFDKINQNRNIPVRQMDSVDRQIIEEIEKSIASVIGASSARHIITTQLLGQDVTAEDLFIVMNQTTQALEFSQEILQASFENISQGLSVVDKNLKLVAWNSPYQKMHDIPDDYLKVGMPIQKIIRFGLSHQNPNIDQLDDLVDQRIAHIKTATPHTSQRWHANGRFIKTTGNPIPTGGYVTSFIDITEQTQTEHALRKSEQRIRIYTDNLPLMLCYVGKDQSVLFSNRAYNEYTGKTDEEIKGLPMMPLFNAQNPLLHHEYTRRALAGELIEFKSTSIDKQNRQTHHQINYFPQKEYDNHINGFFAICQDITSSVEAAQLLEKANEELEKRVSKRTEDLENLNRQLKNENATTLKLTEELKAATKSKTYFLAAASHDLLQPINAARLFTHSVIDTKNLDQKKQLQLLHKIDNSLISADQLLRALLDISKLDAGSLTANFEQFNVNELMNELIVEMSPSAEKKKLKLKFITCNLNIHSDRVLLHSVLQNFISNAIRYTKSGRILVGCRRRPNKQLELQVHDTGIGIKTKDMQTIFTEFHRLNTSSLDQTEQGLGLGLAIAKRVCSILNHPIKVHSTFKKGSCFSVVVPISGCDISPTTIHKQKWNADQNLKNLTILCLENSPQVLDAMQVLLTNWGCKVYCCQTQTQAINMTEQLKIDIVLADYRLDGHLTGIDCLDQLSTVNTAFYGILLTAEQDKSLRTRAQDQGYGFLSKPVEPASLRSLLIRQSHIKQLSSHQK